MQEKAHGDMVDEISEKIGVDPGMLMSTVTMFADRTQRAADQAGLEHDEFLGLLYEVCCACSGTVAVCASCTVLVHTNYNHQFTPRCFWPQDLGKIV